MTFVFRQHAIQRMFERVITVDEVTDALESGRVIENHPMDFPYPSALWLGLVRDTPLHVVVADNASVGERIIITVYQPSSTQWEADWSTRRKP